MADKFICIQCEKDESHCECEKYCTFCQGLNHVRLCSDGCYYCQECREASDLVAQS
jgi:hypothetical protein